MNWQPVRIGLPVVGHKLKVEGKAFSEQYLCGKMSGMIVRVCPLETNFLYDCGGRLFQLHPEDERRIHAINGRFEESNIGLCEHMILAD